MRLRLAFAAITISAAAVSALAFPCMGLLLRSEIITGGIACTYRLSDGSVARMIYRNTYQCPECLR